MSWLKFSKWEIKRSLSPKILASMMVLGASLLAVFIFFRPDISQSMTMEGFYTIIMEDTPELREIGAVLENSPVLDVRYSPGQGDVFFEQKNNRIEAFIDGDPKSLIAFYHVVGAVKRFSHQAVQYPDYVLEPVLVNLVNIDEPGFYGLGAGVPIPPGSIPQFEPFTNISQLIVLLLPIILLASVYSLSLMSEKIKGRITFILMTPFSKMQILMGKMLPYLLISLAFSTFMSISLFHEWVPVAAILFIVNTTFFSVAVLIPLISRSFKEYSFLSTFTYFSFFFLLVFPNIMYGLDTASSLSPLSLLNDASLGKEVLFVDIAFSFLPFIWLSISLLVISAAIFQEEVFLSKKGVLWMFRQAFSAIWERQGSRIASIGLLIFLVIPIIYFFEIIISMVLAVFPQAIGIPLMVISFSLVEEGMKLVPFLGKRVRWFEAALAGALFFAFEKGANLYILLFSIESLSLYTTLMANIWITLLMHVITTTILLSGSRKSRKANFLLAVIIHAGFNFFTLWRFTNV